MFCGSSSELFRHQASYYSRILKPEFSQKNPQDEKSDRIENRLSPKIQNK